MSPASRTVSGDVKGGAPVNFCRVHELPRRDLRPLILESEAEGFAFLARLVREWDAGVNRFEGPHEALIVARCGGQLVGLCGVHRDPYASGEDVARLRHLFVTRERRRTGVGRSLVRRAVAVAERKFRRLRLRTDSDEAAAFYEALGFRGLAGSGSATHEISLDRPR